METSRSAEWATLYNKVLLYFTLMQGLFSKPT